MHIDRKKALWQLFRLLAAIPSIAIVGLTDLILVVIGSIALLATQIAWFLPLAIPAALYAIFSWKEMPNRMHKLLLWPTLLLRRSYEVNDELMRRFINFAGADVVTVR